MRPADVHPVQADEFAQWMSRFAPYERAPRLAVAVSGGRDSLALTHLAADWARARGGQVLAVTVDHGWRDSSAAEAAQVGDWMAAQNIPHTVMVWNSPQTGRGLEAAAREARYGMLEEFCRAQGALHLLLGHHQSDQQETHMMRRARRSGPAGLAGMSGVRELAHLRVLRPLLAVPRARLTATLQARGLDWIEDPSNRDLRFERARLRASSDPAEADSAVRERVARYGRERARLDRECAILAAASVQVNPAGFALLKMDRLRAAASDVARELLGRLVRSVSGGVYPPRGARLSNLWHRIRDDQMDRTRTLAGCLIHPLDDDTLMICREVSALPEPEAALQMPLRGQTRFWDGRFRLAVGRKDENLCVDSLGRAGRNNPDGAGHDDYAGLHRDVRFALPALYRGGELVARPSFDPDDAPARTVKVRFAPQIEVCGAPFGKV
jgi:tRNA(Ile)-lysidine synthase